MLNLSDEVWQSLLDNIGGIVQDDDIVQDIIVKMIARSDDAPPIDDPLAFLVRSAMRAKRRAEQRDARFKISLEDLIPEGFSDVIVPDQLVDRRTPESVCLEKERRKVLDTLPDNFFETAESTRRSRVKLLIRKAQEQELRDARI